MIEPKKSMKGMYFFETNVTMILDHRCTRKRSSPFDDSHDRNNNKVFNDGHMCITTWEENVVRCYACKANIHETQDESNISMFYIMYWNIFEHYNDLRHSFTLDDRKIEYKAAIFKRTNTFDRGIVRHIVMLQHKKTHVTSCHSSKPHHYLFVCHSCYVDSYGYRTS